MTSLELCCCYSRCWTWAQHCRRRDKEGEMTWRPRRNRKGGKGDSRTRKAGRKKIFGCADSETASASVWKPMMTMTTTKTTTAAAACGKRAGQGQATSGGVRQAEG